MNTPLGPVLKGTVAVVVLALVALLAFTITRGPDDTSTVRTFTDAHGRTCTQVTAGASVALDCDHPPAEDRLDGWLDTFTSKP